MAVRVFKTISFGLKHVGCQMHEGARQNFPEPVLYACTAVYCVLLFGGFAFFFFSWKTICYFIWPHGKWKKKSCHRIWHYPLSNFPTFEVRKRLNQDQECPQSYYWQDINSHKRLEEQPFTTLILTPFVPISQNLCTAHLYRDGY